MALGRSTQLVENNGLVRLHDALANAISDLSIQGQGAAIGAVASTLFGALNRSSNNSSYDNHEDQRYAQQQYEHQRIMQERQLAMEGYRRAYGACMGARNYTVQ